MCTLFWARPAPPGAGRARPPCARHSITSRSASQNVCSRTPQRPHFILVRMSAQCQPTFQPGASGPNKVSRAADFPGSGGRGPHDMANTPTPSIR